jgi:hypothetical protein
MKVMWMRTAVPAILPILMDQDMADSSCKQRCNHYLGARGGFASGGGAAIHGTIRLMARVATEGSDHG